MLGKKHNNKKSKFSSIVELSKSKSDLEDYRFFPEDCDEYNVAKKMI